MRQVGIKHHHMETQMTTGKRAKNRQFLDASSFLRLIWAARYRARVCSFKKAFGSIPGRFLAV
jgi:hypothetical protein